MVMYDANKSIMTKETTDYDAIGVCLKNGFSSTGIPHFYWQVFVFIEIDLQKTFYGENNMKYVYLKSPKDLVDLFSTVFQLLIGNAFLNLAHAPYFSFSC